MKQALYIYYLILFCIVGVLEVLVMSIQDDMMLTKELTSLFLISLVLYLQMMI